jgi:uncharacterized membrane protein
MMMNTNIRSLLGILLIGTGVILGLQQFNILGGGWDDALFAVLFAVGALYFYNLFRQNRAQWWFAFVALILSGLAIADLLDVFLPAVGDLIGGAVFFGAIALAFILVYRSDRNNWWALIPAGVMLSLAAVTIADELPSNLPFETGGLLFLGMGLTFFVLYFTKVAGQQLSWAIFPAISLTAFGLFVGFEETASWNYIWPSFIILVGVYFLISSLRKA